MWARGVQTKPEIPTNKDKKRNSRVCRPGAPSSSNSSWAHGETKLFPLSHYEKVGASLVYAAESSSLFYFLILPVARRAEACKQGTILEEYGVAYYQAAPGYFSFVPVRKTKHNQHKETPAATSKALNRCVHS